MKSLSLRRWSLGFGLWALLLLQGCDRAPQTAAELRNRLPHRWRGEIRAPGEGSGGSIGIELRELTVRSEHVLEFNRVRYQMFAGDNVVAEDEVAIRGMITAPGGDIRLDEEGTEAGEILKAGTFKGTLGGDLQSVEAAWTTGSGQAATLKLHAATQ